jgi:hypothetical protein
VKETAAGFRKRLPYLFRNPALNAELANSESSKAFISLSCKGMALSI